MQHEEHEEEEHTVGWFELFYDLVFVAFVIELAAVLKEQTVAIGLPVVILAFLASWTTWFHVNMLMNRTITGGIYQILVYIIAFAMVIIAALSKLNRSVGPANIEAMFFMMVTRLCKIPFMRHIDQLAGVFLWALSNHLKPYDTARFPGDVRKTLLRVPLPPVRPRFI